MEGKPVRLASEKLLKRYQVGKFEGNVEFDSFVMKHMASFDPPEAVEMKDLKTENRKATDEAMTEWNKNPWLLQSVEGDQVYHGKRLGTTNFAVMMADEDGDGYVMAPVREWFEFQKKTNFRPLSIEEAEDHLNALRAKSVQRAQELNKKLASDRVAAEAAVMDVKKAIVNKEADDEERRELGLYGGGGGGDDEDQDNGADFEFECSDDDESAAVMTLTTADDQKEKEIENPLERKVLTMEEKLERKLRKEFEEMERRQEKREREEQEADEEGEKQEKVKKLKKAPTILPLTEQEVIRVLQNDPNVTLSKLIEMFKPSFGTDVDKKNKWLKIVTKVAIQKKVGGVKVLRIRENK